MDYVSTRNKAARVTAAYAIRQRHRAGWRPVLPNRLSGTCRGGLGSAGGHGL